MLIIKYEKTLRAVTYNTSQFEYRAERAASHAPLGGKPSPSRYLLLSRLAAGYKLGCVLVLGIYIR